MRGPSVSWFSDDEVTDAQHNAKVAGKRVERGLLPRRNDNAPAPTNTRRAEMEAMQRRLSERRKEEKNPSARRPEVLE